MWVSLEVDLEDLPVLDEELPLGVSGEGEAGLGTADVLAVVVADGELGVGPLLVAVVDDADVAAPEDGPLVGVVGDGELREVQVELLPHVQREDEGLEGLVRRPLLLRRAPGDGRVPPDHLPELRLDQRQRAALPVALLVELLDGEGVLGGAEDQLETGDLVVEEAVDGGDVADDLAVEGGHVTHLGGEGGGTGGGAFPLDPRLEVEVAGLLDEFADLLLERDHLALGNLGHLHAFGGEHLSEDGAEVVAVDLREVVLGEVLDELHDLDAVAVGLHPQFELPVLRPHLVQQVHEHRVHLVPDVPELLRPQVRVVVHHRLDLRPLHLRTVLVEQAALVLAVEPVLADEAWLAAGGVRADCETRLPVDALGALVSGVT